jgi:cell division transport system permease protein
MSEPLIRAPFDAAGLAERLKSAVLRVLGRDPEHQRAMPLVPAASIAGRALVTVIAIMTFLAGLTAGAAQLVASASSDWRAAIATELTIQVRPVPGRSLDQDVARAAAVAKATAGVDTVRPYSREESERLLEPWLGAGLAFDELPIPRLIVVKIRDGDRVDLAGLRRGLAETVKNAVLDDHRIWVERLASMARTLVLFALAILGLVITATGLAVAFATQGAMAGNKDVIEVLHFVGATDSYIAREFQMHFLRLGLKGGLIGGCAATLFYMLAQVMAAAWVATPGGDQIEALFGSFSLDPWGYAAVAAIALLVAVITGIVSRATVQRTLGGLS